jgi:hypothetical protein
MQKHLKILLFSILSFIQFMNAQDSLFLKNGLTEVVYVDEISGINLRYKKENRPKSRIYSIVKYEVSHIRCSDGIRLNLDSIAESSGDYENPLSPWFMNEDMFKRGGNDAKWYYNFTFSGSAGDRRVIVTPRIRVYNLNKPISDVIMAFSPPSGNHMNYPSASLWRNPYYRDGYALAALKIRRRKLWIATGIGLGVGAIICTSYVAAFRQ